MASEQRRSKLGFFLGLAAMIIVIMACSVLDGQSGWASRIGLASRTGLASRIDNREGPPLDGEMAKFKPVDPAVPAPPAAFVDTGGRKLTLQAFKGKFLLVNLWATWCAPCIEEIPSLVKLKQAYDSSKFQVVNIAEDHAEEAAIDRFLAKRDAATLDHYRDPDSNVGNNMGLESLPTTFIISSNGDVLGRLEGKADWNGPDARRLIDWYLGRKPANLPATEHASYRNEGKN